MSRLRLSSAVLAALSLVFLLRGDAHLAAQHRLVSLVSQYDGHVALGLAIRRLNVSGTFLQTAAHPDDEHNQLYAMFTLGQGLRSIDVQTTRGGGGQNEIGPELFQDIAVLRTSELLAAHQLDGAQQVFTRAIDFGYSFSPPEIYEKWGRTAVVGDFVRFIRQFRPDVVLTMNIQGRGGDRAHEATAVLTREAFRAAADPAQYPEQIQEGLRPWQAKKLYFTAGFGGFGGPAPAPNTPLCTVDANLYDALLGRTYAAIGTDARANHKCQGMGGFALLAGVSGGRGFGPIRYMLEDTTIPGQKGKSETSLFDGIDTRLTALAQYAGPNPPAALTGGLAAIAAEAEKTQKAYDTVGDGATAAPIVAGLEALRRLRAGLGAMGLGDDARYEIDSRLAVKENDWVHAALEAHSVSFEALGDDGLVIGGQPERLSLVVANRGGSPVTVSGIDVAGFDGQVSCPSGPVAAGEVYTCTPTVQVPKDARLTTRYWTDEYWDTKPPKAALQIYPKDVPFGLPFRPTPFRATFHLKVGGADVSENVRIEYRYVEDPFTGEKRMELNVVPAFSVRMTAPLAVIPASASPVEREIHVSVTNGTKGAAHATVALEAPSGWTVTPPSAPIDFGREDEALTVRFMVTAPGGTPHGDYHLRAVVTSPATGTQRFDSGYQVIEYPHIERRQVIKPAETDVEVMNVKTTPGIRVGYIVGAGDQVPPALEQLGAKVSFIGSDELAWGDLSSKYDVIMTGVRAYERRDDLRAYNQRVLDFAARGGTVIIQYNKMEFNQAQYGPYPAEVGRGRVTDENAPVKVLQPDNPVFNAPNRIDASSWAGWVQERGLYFLGEKDPRYVDLVSMEDPFPDNPGVKTGTLVEATVGKGRWLYVGLGLWRQAPAGVEGAYQLLANLISLPKTAAQ